MSAPFLEDFLATVKYLQEVILLNTQTWAYAVLRALVDKKIADGERPTEAELAELKRLENKVNR